MVKKNFFFHTTLQANLHSKSKFLLAQSHNKPISLKDRLGDLYKTLQQFNLLLKLGRR